MKRLINLIIALVLIVTVFAGCGTTQTTETQTSADTSTTAEAPASTQPEIPALSGKIVFSTNRTDLADTKLKDLAKEFMDKNPGTEVEFEGIKDPATVINTRMAANELSDITLIPATVKSTDLPDFFAPLDDLGYTKDNLYFYSQGLGPDGKLYRITDSISTAGIVYNKKAFEAAGITSAPKTEEEFLAACEKLKAMGIVPYATNFKDAWPLWSYIAYPIVLNNDPEYWWKKASSDEYFSDDGLNKLVNLLITMRDKGYIEKDLMSTNWDSMIRDMATGKIAMAYLADWFPAALAGNGAKLEDIGMFPFPGLKTASINGGWYLGISKNSKSLPLAKAFMKYCWDEGRYSNATGTAPSLRTVKNTIQADAEILSYGTPVEQFSDSDDYTMVANKAQFDMTKELQNILLAKTPDEVTKVINDANKKWADARKALGK